MAPPNKRVQRTRLRSPLTRHPLGGANTHSWRPTRATVCAVALVLALRSTADSKCISIAYELSGSVVDCQSGHPLSGAQVLCFADDETEAWPTEYRGPSAAASDQEGVFKGRYYFNTYSGEGDALHPDRCEKHLKRVTVVVTLEGYSSARVVAGGPQISRVRNGSATVRVPPIRLIREGSSCCPS